MCGILHREPGTYYLYFNLLFETECCCTVAGVPKVELGGTNSALARYWMWNLKEKLL